TFYPFSYLCLLEDKLVFEKFINNFPRYAPKNIGSVSRYHFYLQDGLPQPLENILKYPMNCIVKNIWGFGGRNIFLLKIEEGKLFINGVQSTMEEFIKRLPEKAVLQEILEQHQVLRELHPYSINTARIVTVNTGTEVKVISTFLRVGVNGNYVDNIAQGNIFVPIDRSTGKLAREGHTNYHIRILKHPQTEVTFEGIEIPFYDEAKELCRKLHFQLPYFFILGWDIAFTPSGPVVIESNNIHKLVDEQKFEGGLRKQFDIYIKEFIENKRKERKFDYA
ncbi:MAG TPA: sugar-transfer associated ATP-grasp domain-containing protein, partial [Bacteroidales bacterium]|nr:sugar-transfer associated ATP-grasp domain-containing protein [Bacteroidales bacterium]